MVGNATPISTPGDCRVLARERLGAVMMGNIHLPASVSQVLGYKKVKAGWTMYPDLSARPVVPSHLALRA
jgi:hypothetical protein